MFEFTYDTNLLISVELVSVLIHLESTVIIRISKNIYHHCRRLLHSMLFIMWS